MFLSTFYVTMFSFCKHFSDYTLPVYTLLVVSLLILLSYY